MISVKLNATYTCRIFYKNNSNKLSYRDVKCSEFSLDNDNCIKCFLPKRNKYYNIVYAIIRGKKIHPYYFGKHIRRCPKIWSKPISKNEFELLYTSGLSLKEISEITKSSEYVIKNFFLKNFLSFERLKLKKLHFNNINNNDKINVDIDNTI